jgi:hypothetical protein
MYKSQGSWSTSPLILEDEKPKEHEAIYFEIKDKTRRIKIQKA